MSRATRTPPYSNALFTAFTKCARTPRTLLRGDAVGRVSGLVLPKQRARGPKGGVIKCAEQVDAARLELGGDVAARELLLRRILPLKLSVR